LIQRLRPARAYLLALVLLLTSFVATTLPSVHAAADFSVSVSPSSLSVAQGSSGTTTVIVSSLSGFSSPVSLAVFGLPAGVLAGFGTNPVTPPAGGTASSSLIVSVGVSVVAASYTLTVAGTSGTVSHSAALTLTVTPSGPTSDFMVTVSPATVSVAQSGSASVTVTVTSIGTFSSPVALIVSGIPAGVGVSFSANPVTPAAGKSTSSTLSINAASWATKGTYVLTVAGTSGTLTRSTTFTVVVKQALTPDFSITSSSSTISITQGSSGSTTLSVTSINGFSAVVGLSLAWIETAPSGVTVSLPTSVTPLPGGTATLALTVAANSKSSTGTFPLRVTGTSGALRHSLDVRVQIAAARGDFSLVVTPASVSLQPGTYSTLVVAVQSLGSFSSAAYLSSLGTPNGITVAFGMNPVTPPAGGTASSTVIVTVGPRVVVGTYMMTIRGTSGSLSHDTILTVIIPSTVGGDFAITAVPSVGVSQGSTATATIAVVSINGFSSSVTLSGSWLSSAPSGVTFVIPPVTPLPNATATSPLSISASTGAVLGNYTLRIAGTSGSLSHFMDILVTVKTPQCFIATATYGSELSPEVQFLRNFRDNTILKTRAGSAFMGAFNNWYYSFSPAVAQFIVQHKTLRTVAKIALYPLIWILRIGANANRLVPTNPETGVVMSGLVISSLIGVSYLAFPMTAALSCMSGARRTARRLEKPFAVLILAALAAITMAEILTLPAVLMSVIASLLVLGVLTLSGLLTSRIALRLLRRP